MPDVSSPLKSPQTRIQGYDSTASSFTVERVHSLNPVEEGGRDMDARFQPAQAALASGDVEQMARLFHADPDLATALSTRSHPTILQCLVLTMPPVDSLEALIVLLADHGAELTDPLIAASGISNVRAISSLLDLGARIEGSGRWSSLEEALYSGNEAAASLLLKRGAAVHNLRTAAGLGDMTWIARGFSASGRRAAPQRRTELNWTRSADSVIYA